MIKNNKIQFIFLFFPLLVFCYLCKKEGEKRGKANGGLVVVINYPNRTRQNLSLFTNVLPKRFTFYFPKQKYYYKT